MLAMYDVTHYLLTMSIFHLKRLEKPLSDLAAVQAKAPVKLKSREVSIMGKVVRVRRYEQFFYTAVICPAVDVYSKPQVVEIRSKLRFAENDEEITVIAVLGGYEGKPYQVTDRETGERRQLVPVHHFLDLVE